MTTETLVGVLRRHVEEQPDKVLFRQLLTGEAEGPRQELTYSELDLGARAIAAWLQARRAPGQRALLFYPPGLEFMKALFGCLYGGVIAVPAYPPDPTRLSRSLPRLQAIAGDSDASFVLTTHKLLAGSAALLPELPTLREREWVASASFEKERAAAWRSPALNGDSAAFLQYTSGSTGRPRGVAVSHRNLLHNERMVQACCGDDRASNLCCWMPVAHDMGLILHVLYTAFLGGTCTLMTPQHFIQRPVRWLEAITHFRVRTSGGPSFAFELCARKVRPEDRQRLDLRCWRSAINGAEPIRAATLERFIDAFGACGFRPEALCPAYGLAESTAIVTGASPRRGAVVATIDAEALRSGRWRRQSRRGEESQQIVSCGRPLLDQEVTIVDPETRRRCAQGYEGEIWLRGPSTTAGYWNRPRESAAVFAAELADSADGRYLRTGDLGVIDDGELYVTGRRKDLIIIAGRNLHPHDIEHTVESSHPSLRPGCSAAFPLDVEDEERLGVVAEMDPRRGGAPPSSTAEVIATVRQAVSEQHSMTPYVLVLIEPHTIPKTNSGKIQRRACRALFLADELRIVEVMGHATRPIAREPRVNAPLAGGRSDEGVGQPPQHHELTVAKLEALFASQLQAFNRLAARQIDTVCAAGGAVTGATGADSIIKAAADNLPKNH